MTLKITGKNYDREFVRKLEEISGENFHKCMQCGTCTAGCPMISEMDHPPRKVILMSHFGFKEIVLQANTPWLCATCNTCSVRCPRGIDLPRLMEAVRLITLRENRNHVEPGEIPKDVLRKSPQIALVSCFRKHTS
ncbi:MAG: 4Fe-4S dicluster domain-containing protein [Planctomycetota bacterium]